MCLENAFSRRLVWVLVPVVSYRVKNTTGSQSAQANAKAINTFQSTGKERNLDGIGAWIV
jgi:hypothetical protein